jgi:hypothetical protein
MNRRIAPARQLPEIAALIAFALVRAALAAVPSRSLFTQSRPRAGRSKETAMTPDDGSDEPLQFPPEAAARLDALFAQRLSTMTEIAASLARDAGYGELASLAPQTRRALEEAVEEACDDWRLASAPTAATPAPHQRLLAQYHALGATILDIQDAVLRQALGGAVAPPAWRLAKV